MIFTISRSVYRVLGIPLASVTRQHATADASNPGAPLASPALTEHGYAYSCPRCAELLLEGLAEPITGADEIELILHHNCQRDTEDGAGE
ncbi:hypothetical protein ACQPW1_10415 [Nocardia sp. CA-128927]|uniref:hypothetical protein n=1 Tax=Nocardia sp. CA-128927 TaxID=3239975 RepID=UPI003D964FDE